MIHPDDGGPPLPGGSEGASSEAKHFAPLPMVGSPGAAEGRLEEGAPSPPGGPEEVPGGVAQLPWRLQHAHAALDLASREELAVAIAEVKQEMDKSGVKPGSDDVLSMVILRLPRVVVWAHSWERLDKAFRPYG